MELWLLGAGAIVLIAITLWIVWPARTADAVGATVPNEEVSTNRMTENVGSAMAPQGDRFEDQYTSATADLSAGGVATAMQSESAGHQPADASSHRWSPPSAGADYSSPLSTHTETKSLAQPRTIGMGAGALLSIGGALGGAWLYARWQRERNKPINRLRRGARDVATRLGERMPDVDDLPHAAAPMSGAATALLLTGLVASRALRRGSADRTEDALNQTNEYLDRGRELIERGRKESRRLSSRLPTDLMPSNVEPRKPAILGIGFGGLAILAGGTYLVWRIVRGGAGTGTSWTSYSAE
jgi:hypothetical protein